MFTFTDSSDLPLNVNREDLQKSKIMTIISRKLTRKALDMLRDLARRESEDLEDDEDEGENSENEGDGDDDDNDNDTSKDKQLYTQFWDEFGKSIKLGILEDTRNRKRLLDLLRFPSAHSTDNPISLEKYIENMKDGQKYIYYIAAGNADEAENSPFMERFRAKNYDVLYFIDNLDEYLNLQEYDDIPFQSITKEDVELDGKKMKDFLKSKEEEFSELRTWLKDLYGNKVSKVQISNTLSESPMAISTGKYGYSANMERIAKAQAFGAQQHQMRATKILQLNYRHPIIIELRKRVEDGDTDTDTLEGQRLSDYANILLDSALIKSGFEIETDDQTEYDERIQRIIRNSLEISQDAQLEPEPEFANEIDEDNEDEDDDEDEDEDEEFDDELDDTDKEEL